MSAQSEAVLAILLKAVDEASSVMKGVSEAAEHQGDAIQDAARKADAAAPAAGRLGGALGGLGSAFARVGEIATGFVVGSVITQLPGFLMDAAKGAAEDEAATMRLTKSLENYAATLDDDVAGATEELLGDVEERIAAGQRLAFSDDAVRDSLQTLLAATGDYDEATKRQAAAMDLARGKGISLEQASTLLAKANEENVNVLRRMGIVLKDNATEADLLAAVNQKFGGQAEQFARSNAGTYEQAKIRLAEVTEQIGSYLLPVMATLGAIAVDYVLPGLEAGATALGPVFSSAIGAAAPFVDVLVALAAGAQDFVFALLWVVENGRGFEEGLAGGAWGELAERIGLVVVWIRDSLIPAFLELGARVRPYLEAFVAVVGEQFQAFAAYYESDIRPAVDNIVAALSWLGEQAATIIGGVVAFVSENWPLIEAVISPILAQIENVFRATFDVIGGILRIAIDLIGGDFSGAWVNFRRLIGDVFRFFVDTAKNAFDLLGALGPLAFSAALAVGVAVKDGIIAGIRGAVGVIGDLGEALLSALKMLINSAIDAVNQAIPDSLGINVFGTFIGIDLPDNPIPRLANGGIVRARPGGTLALIGEGGRDEAVVPLGGGGGGGSTVIPIYIGGERFADVLLDGIVGLEAAGRIRVVTY